MEPGAARAAAVLVASAVRLLAAVLLLGSVLLLLALVGQSAAGAGELAAPVDGPVAGTGERGIPAALPRGGAAQERAERATPLPGPLPQALDAAKRTLTAADPLVPAAVAGSDPDARSVDARVAAAQAAGSDRSEPARREGTATRPDLRLPARERRDLLVVPPEGSGGERSDDEAAAGTTVAGEGQQPGAPGPTDPAPRMDYWINKWYQRPLPYLRLDDPAINPNIGWPIPLDILLSLPLSIRDRMQRADIPVPIWLRQLDMTQKVLEAAEQQIVDDPDQGIAELNAHFESERALFERRRQGYVEALISKPLEAKHQALMDRRRDLDLKQPDDPAKAAEERAALDKDFEEYQQELRELQQAGFDPFQLKPPPSAPGQPPNPSPQNEQGEPGRERDSSLSPAEPGPIEPATIEAATPEHPDALMADAFANDPATTASSAPAANPVVTATRTMPGSGDSGIVRGDGSAEVDIEGSAAAAAGSGGTPFPRPDARGTVQPDTATPETLTVEEHPSTGEDLADIADDDGTAGPMVADDGTESLFSSGFFVG